MRPTYIYFKQTPSFAEIHEIAKDFYVVMAGCSEGSYAIVLELAGNGKVNHGAVI